MKFDDILRTVGEFGPYQRRLYVILVLLKFTVSWATMVAVFLNASVDHWCATPEWDSGCEQYGLSEEDCELAKKTGSIPSNYTSDGKLEYAQCEKYDVSGVGFWSGIDPSNYSSQTMSCDSGWVYDDSQYESSTVSDFDLVCGSEDLTQVSQSIYYGGYLAGSILFGILSDIIGRWWSLLLSNIIAVASGIAIAFSPNWWFFATMRFFMGFGNIAFNIILYIIGTEYIGPSKRNLVMLATISYALGYMFLALPAYFIRSWRTLQLVITAPLIPVFLAFIWLPESARWLISSGKYDDAEKIINKVAEVNKAELPKPLFTKEFIEEQDEIRKARRPTFIDLVRTPRMRLRTINMAYIWMVNSLVYHGLSLNSSNLGTNDYVAFAISGAIEIPAYLMDVVIVQVFGRKLSLSFCMMLGGLACLSTAFIPPGAVLTTVAMIGKFGISGSFTIIYLYTVELYPTNVRGVAIGSCSMFSRIAGIVAPLILVLDKYWAPLPLVIYGSVSVVASLTALALPETRGKKLPETLEEGERFGLNNDMDENSSDRNSEYDLCEAKKANGVSKENGNTLDISNGVTHDNPVFEMEDESGEKAM
ncbi:organic cation transporter protein-like isoform X1 [Lytechinus variegatus]|uniref:organic cation transporter protein-like isoform X1 n=1 Tax=Lytechinus variegatus TaxID=7654 RepID=UPI001BB1DC56|nr:organic cation transporter protein-like isoform X1 [Lytechinus variegatus]